MTDDEMPERLDLGEALQPADPGRPRANEISRRKAQAVLKALTAGGLRAPFNIEMEDAIDLWAVKLGQYPTDVLMEATQVWIYADDKEFPSVGQLATQAAYIARQYEPRRVNDQVCPECEGDHWVTVVDSVEQVETFKSKQLHTRKFTQDDDGDPDNREYIEVPRTHKRPCSTCPGMRRRYELYTAGHFGADHVAGGGCRECYDYTAQAIKDRARKGYR